MTKESKYRDSAALPADPDNFNVQRSLFANVAIENFRGATGTDIEDAVADLLCNLMHWCDRFTGESFDAAFERAYRNYTDETGGEGKQARSHALAYAVAVYVSDMTPDDYLDEDFDIRNDDAVDIALYALGACRSVCGLPLTEGEESDK